MATLIGSGPAHSDDARKSTLDVVKARGTLIVGLKKDFPPTGFIDQQGNWTGYEVDFAEYVASKLGVKLQKEVVTSATRVPLLMNGNLDVVIATMLPTTERAKLVDFSLPYYIGGDTVLVRKGSGIKGIQDLAAPKKTGMAQGSGDIQIFKAYQPKAQIVTYQEWPIAAMALADGRVDAIATSDPTLRGIAKSNPSLEIVGEPYYYETYCMGVRQNDSKWRLFLDETIGEAWADGTLARLYTKYFGTKIPELPVWAEFKVPRNPS
jgi:polar amino acid transport system substrate-binding protein